MDGETTTIRIPKRIVQTAKTRPQTVRLRAIEGALRRLHPEYEFLFFDNTDVEEFIDREFAEMRDVFAGFRYPIQRYDFFRYLAIYRYGGFYFDTDVLLGARLDPLLENSCVFPFEQISLNPYLRERCGLDWEAGNYAFGAAAGHPFLRALIDNCVRAQRDAAWVEEMLHGIPRVCRPEYEVLCSTGPGMATRTLAEQTEASHEVTILFPEDVRNRNAWNCFGEYGVHLMDGGWRPDKGRVARWLERRRTDRMREQAVRASAGLGPRRCWPRED